MGVCEINLHDNLQLKVEPNGRYLGAFVASSPVNRCVYFAFTLGKLGCFCFVYMFLDFLHV